MVDAVFGPILRCAPAALGSSSTGSVGPSPILLAHRKAGRSRCGAGSCTPADRVQLIASASQPGAQVLRECDHGPLGGHFGRAKTGSLVPRLAFWVGQDVDVAECVCSCQTCQHTKAEHCCPRGLLHPLLLQSRSGGVIGVDWIAGLPTTPAGFDMIQNHVDPSLALARSTQFQCARQRLRRTLSISFKTCAFGPATGSWTCSWWITTPSSRARCSGSS